MMNFIQAYNNLEIDKYVLNKENKPYRKRRYGSFILDTQNLQLSINEHKTFFQSTKVNSAYGGIQREFAPITDDIMQNQFLQEIIKSDFSVLPDEDKNKSSKWFVGVQMFRIEATKDYEGEPSPEGIHQDEHYFVLQHMINKQNAQGGESTIFNLQKEKIVSLTFENFMDSCFVKDEMVMHDVSSVKCKDDSKKAIRDMLILDFELMD
jgi:hypothetical protein